jgi:hypothetical protein
VVPQIIPYLGVGLTSGKDISLFTFFFSGQTGKSKDFTPVDVHYCIPVNIIYYLRSLRRERITF